MTVARYVILDRDGVINRDSDDFVKSPEEWIPIDRSLEAIALLHRFGYKIIVATNQSGIARGYFDLDMLRRIHDKMLRLVGDSGGKIDAIYFCPHGPNDRCNCRKPGTGLLKQFAREFNATLDNIPFIGDSLRDIEAGTAVGARPLLVKTGKGRRTLKQHPELNIPVFDHLYDASQFIIAAT